MTDFIHRMIDQVTNAAKRIHGRYSTRSAYRTALVAELESEGIPVRIDVTFPGCYDDVVVHHCLDLIAGSQLGVELRSAENILPSHYNAALLQFYLSRAGLNHGLLLDFAGQELKSIPVELSAAHGASA